MKNKKNNILILLLSLVLIFSVDKVNAKCDNNTQLEINTASSNVSMNYYVNTVVYDREGNEHPEISPSDVDMGELSEYVKSGKVVIRVENITDKIYVVFQNLDEGINKEYHYQDLKDGTLVYEVPDVEKIRTYKLIIYSDVGDCLNEELRNIEIKTPMYNENSDFAFCQGNNNYYCQEYVTTVLSNNDAEKAYNDYLSSLQNSEENGENKSSEKNNRLIINIGIITAVILVIAIIFVGYKKKKNKQSIGGM